MVRPRVRQQILDTAADLLRTEGIAALTTRNLARQAGVTQASVFNNFGDKAGLLQALLLDLPEHQQLAERLNALAGREPVLWLQEAFIILSSFFEQLLPLSLPVLEAGGSDEASTLLDLIRRELLGAMLRQGEQCTSWSCEQCEAQTEQLLSQSLLAAYSRLLSGCNQGYQGAASRWLERHNHLIPVPG